MSVAEPSPFFFPRGDRAILCVHGFSGSPYEVRPLGEALAEAGYTVLGLRLPGHESLASLARASKEEWQRAVLAAIGALGQSRGVRGPVGLAGMSMGGSLSLWAASQRPEEVGAVAAFGTPAFLSTAATRAAAVAKRIRLERVLTSLPKIAGSDIGDEAMRKANPTLPGTPVAAVYQLLGLLEELRERLPGVRQPLLLCHGMQDRTVPPENLAYLAERVSSREVEVLRYPASRHILTLDVDRERVARAAVSFFQRSLGAPVPAEVRLPEGFHV